MNSSTCSMSLRLEAVKKFDLQGFLGAMWGSGYKNQRLGTNFKPSEPL